MSNKNNIYFLYKMSISWFWIKFSYIADIYIISRSTMNCPYCNEKIKDGAKKCRFCGEFLEKQETIWTDEEFEVKTYWVESRIIYVARIFWILWIFVYLWIVLICYAIILQCRKLEIHKDCIVYKHWVFVKKREEIPYKKINSVDSSTFIVSDLIIRTWNDKPVIFKYIEKKNEVVALIKKMIKE